MFRRLFCTTALLLTLSLPTWAATNPLSVHVLDQVSGQPAPGIAVVLEQQQGPSWKTLNQGTTDAQGRIKGLDLILKIVPLRTLVLT
jgi:5-hydroxyisourate hydrolase